MHGKRKQIFKSTSYKLDGQPTAEEEVKLLQPLGDSPSLPHNCLLPAWAEAQARSQIRVGP